MFSQVKIMISTYIPGALILEKGQWETKQCAWFNITVSANLDEKEALYIFKLLPGFK